MEINNRRSYIAQSQPYYQLFKTNQSKKKEHIKGKKKSKSTDKVNTIIYLKSLHLLHTAFLCSMLSSNFPLASQLQSMLLNVQTVLVLEFPQFHLVLASVHQTLNSILSSQSRGGPCCIGSQRAIKKKRKQGSING